MIKISKMMRKSKMIKIKAPWDLTAKFVRGADLTTFKNLPGGGTVTLGID